MHKAPTITREEYEGVLDDICQGSLRWVREKGAPMGHWIIFSDNVVLKIHTFNPATDDDLFHGSSFVSLTSRLNGRMLDRFEDGQKSVRWDKNWEEKLKELVYYKYIKYKNNKAYYDRVAEIPSIKVYVEEWTDKITNFSGWKEHPELSKHYDFLEKHEYLSKESEKSILDIIGDTSIKHTPKIVLIRVLYFLAKTEGNERLMKVCKDYGDALKANPDAKAPPLVKGNLRSREHDIQRVLDANPRLRT